MNVYYKLKMLKVLGEKIFKPVSIYPLYLNMFDYRLYIEILKHSKFISKNLF